MTQEVHIQSVYAAPSIGGTGFWGPWQSSGGVTVSPTLSKNVSLSFDVVSELANPFFVEVRYFKGNEFVVEQHVITGGEAVNITVQDSQQESISTVKYRLKSTANGMEVRVNSGDLEFLPGNAPQDINVEKQNSILNDVLNNPENNDFNYIDPESGETENYAKKDVNVDEVTENMGATGLDPEDRIIVSDDNGNDISIVNQNATATVSGTNYLITGLVDEAIKAAEKLSSFVSSQSEKAGEWFTDSAPGGIQQTFSTWLGENIANLVNGSLDAEDAFIDPARKTNENNFKQLILFYQISCVAGEQ